MRELCWTKCDELYLMIIKSGLQILKNWIQAIYGSCTWYKFYMDKNYWTQWEHCSPWNGCVSNVYWFPDVINMKRAGVNSAYFIALHNFYEWCLGAVRVGNKMSLNFEVTKDLRHLLYINSFILIQIYINAVLSRWKRWMTTDDMFLFEMIGLWSHRMHRIEVTWPENATKNIHFLDLWHKF